MCYSPWGRKVLDTTERLNNNKRKVIVVVIPRGVKPSVYRCKVFVLFLLVLVCFFVFFLLLFDQL